MVWDPFIFTVVVVAVVATVFLVKSWLLQQQLAQASEAIKAALQKAVPVPSGLPSGDAPTDAAAKAKEAQEEGWTPARLKSINPWVEELAKGTQPTGDGVASAQRVREGIEEKVGQHDALLQYLIGGLTLLGLLFTFVGMQETISQTQTLIGALQADQGEVKDAFTKLMGSLDGVLKGMVSAFWRSIWALGCSVVLGLLASLVQGQRERALEACEPLVWAVRRVQGLNPGSAEIKSIMGAMEGFQELLSQQARSLKGLPGELTAPLYEHGARLASTHQVLSKLGEGLAENSDRLMAQQEAHMKVMGEQHGLLEAFLEQFNNVDPSSKLTQMVEDLRNVSATAANNSSLLRQSLDSFVQDLKGGLKDLELAGDKQMGAVAAGQDRIHAGQERLVEAILKLPNATELAEALAQISERGNQHQTELGSSLLAAVRQLKTSLDREGMGGMGTEIQELRQALVAQNNLLVGMTHQLSRPWWARLLGIQVG